MAGQGKLITGVVVGAGAMYLLDPDRGARRRSLLRDQGLHAGHKLGDGLAATARDAKNRTVGVAAELRSRFQPDQAGDEVLHERVRSAIGRVVSHPAAVTVTASEGRVTLTGHVLEDEVEALIRRVSRVRGVQEVRNELEMHQSADNVPALQGMGRVPDEQSDSWTPTTRLLVGAAGGLLTLQGVRTGGAPGTALSVVGVGLLARAIANIPSRELVGVGTQRRGFAVEKTIALDVPVERVWDLWSNFENFPRFMTHLREVRKLDESRSHWVAVGPVGVPVEWDAIVTDWVPYQFIGWRSVEGSPVETSGQVRFRRVGDDRSEVDVRLAYSPPGGAVGHAVAALWGTDPKRAMDDDLVRFKSLLEEGKTSADGEQVRLEEVVPGSAPRKATRSRRSS